MPTYALAGKTVMVTGAGKGIGLAIAQAFAAQGCRLNAVDRDAEALQGARTAYSGATETKTVACDLGREADLARLRDEARAFGGQLHAQAMPALLEPADIAGIYLFLASRDAHPITGQAIVVSNGEVMH